MKTSRNSIKWIIGAILAVVVVIGGGTYIYIHFIEGDPPSKLTFSDSTQIVSTETLGDINGTWVPATTSQVGYRVDEVLFGQNTTAVGRTNDVTGTLVIDGKNVTTVDLTADMTSVKSDQSNRDNQFKSRIMEVSKYPTATFKLEKPITLDRTPDQNAQTVKATGTLTMHGISKAVTFDLAIRHTTAGVEVNGTIPVTFADYRISNPSFGPAQVGDTGELEVLITFTRPS